LCGPLRECMGVCVSVCACECVLLCTSGNNCVFTSVDGILWGLGALVYSWVLMSLHAFLCASLSAHILGVSVCVRG